MYSNHATHSTHKYCNILGYINLSVGVIYEKASI